MELVISFTMNPNLKKFLGRGGGGGARVSDFFTLNPNLKNKKKCFFWRGVGGGWEGG